MGELSDEDFGEDFFDIPSTGSLALDAQLSSWENEGISAWFKEMCGQPGNKDLCPAAEGEWYLDPEGRTRCKLCSMNMN